MRNDIDVKMIKQVEQRKERIEALPRLPKVARGIPLSVKVKFSF